MSYRCGIRAKVHRPVDLDEPNILGDGNVH